MDPDFPFIALVEHTNMRSPAEYSGRHLVCLGNYRPMDDPIFSTDAERLLSDAAPYLARLNPRFETPLPGLFVANMFQVYPHDRGQNYSIGLAERLIRTLP
jgi:protoporphyrinogen oxidase